MDRETFAVEEGESVSALLSELNRGNRDALPRLMPLVYAELRRVAARFMARERRDDTLQPTALVNEAYIRLVESPEVEWRGRAHFFAVAAQVMRHILVDRARARRADRRGGGVPNISLDGVAAEMFGPSIDVLILDEALSRLATLDARQCRVVELRFFGGLKIEEIAFILGSSDRTVKRDWRMARAWLHAELSQSPSQPRKTGGSDER